MDDSFSSVSFQHFRQGPDHFCPVLIRVHVNKINQDDEERPISFSCKMTPSDSFLWNLEDFQIFQVSKEAVDQLKKIPMQDQ